MSKSLDEIWRQMQAQKAAEQQRRLAEERAIYEQRERARQEYLQRIRMFERFNPTSAASAAAGAGGTVRTQSNFLAYNFQTGDLYSIDEQGNLEIVSQIFNGITVLSDCFDDSNFVYFVTYDTDLSKVIFGKFDKVNYQRIDIDDTNLNSEIDLDPNSLYYAGSGNFIYSAESFGSSPETQGIYSISIDGQTITQLSTFDGDTTVLSSIFEYGGQTFATIFEGFTTSSLNSIDLNSGLTELVDLFSMNVDTLPDNISSNTKVWLILDVKVKNGEIWTSMVFFTKDGEVLPYACIGKINFEEASIDFVVDLPTPLSSDILFTSFVVL
jgi:hypothetical protein